MKTTQERIEEIVIKYADNSIKYTSIEKVMLQKELEALVLSAGLDALKEFKK